MAKSKKRRRKPPPRSGSQQRRDRPAASRGISRPGASRAATPKELRREWEARHPQEARRRRRGRLLLAASSLLALTALTLYLTRPRFGPPLSPSQRAILARAPAAADAAGCRGVKSVGPYRPESEDRTHLSSSFPPLSRYRTHPPASGPHAGVTLPSGVYRRPPAIPEAIHSLEHGAVEIWYDPSASGNELSRIRSFFASSPENDHLIVAPYSYPAQGAAGRLPPGIKMALVAWHRIELCAEPSFPAAFDFVVRFRFPPPKGLSYQGTAPEAGVGI